jgi:hypothetical protein
MGDAGDDAERSDEEERRTWAKRFRSCRGS